MDQDTRINHQIKAFQVFLIGAEGEKLGIHSFREAIQMAQDQGLDLVEMSNKTNPPACKLMDYKKYQFEQKKKASAIAKANKQLPLKEVQIHSSTDINDLNTKLKHVMSFLEDGHKVKISVRFRGGEIRHTHLGVEKLDWFSEQTKAVAQIERAPLLEGKQLFMILAPL